MEIKKSWSKTMLTGVVNESSSIPAIASKPLNENLQLWYCDIKGCRTAVADRVQLTELLEDEAAK